MVLFGSAIDGAIQVPSGFEVSNHTAAELETLISAVEDFIANAEFYREARDQPAWNRQELEAEVARAAGRASGATEASGHYQVDGSGRTRVTYDPIQNWNQAINPLVDSLTEAIRAAHQIQGVLEAKATRARRDEASLVGRVAVVVGFPGLVRKHLADRGLSPSTQRIGFILSITAQVLATVIGGLILIWLGALIWGTTIG